MGEVPLQRVPVSGLGLRRRLVGNLLGVVLEVPGSRFRVEGGDDRHVRTGSWTGPPLGKRAPRVGISSTVFGVRV